MHAMEPAASIIRKFGGVSATASVTGVHRTRVSNWMRAREAGGTGGMIPQRHIASLIGAAAERGLDLTVQDFFPELHQEPAQ